MYCYFDLDEITYMKKEAVTIKPMASIKTAKVGYQTTGTGLEIGFTD